MKKEPTLKNQLPGRSEMLNYSLKRTTTNRLFHAFVVSMIFISFNTLAAEPSGWSPDMAEKKAAGPVSAAKAEALPPLAPDTPIGSFLVGDGPLWTTDPQTYTCMEACSTVFGGTADMYACSTVDNGINNLAWASTWGANPNHCSNGTAVADDFKLGTNYDCGSGGCSISAYVQDHCGDPGINTESTNYCYLAAPPDPVPTMSSWSSLLLVVLLGLVGFSLRHRFITT
jgi:hypothetical protein